MKSAKLIGKIVGICRKGNWCHTPADENLLVAAQDDVSISSENGERVMYSEVSQLTYPASKTDEIKNDAAKAAALPFIVICAAVRNDCSK
jgi:hypothetical protein